MKNPTQRRRSVLKATMTFADGSRAEVNRQCSDEVWAAAFMVLMGEVAPGVVTAAAPHVDHTGHYPAGIL